MTIELLAALYFYAPNCDSCEEHVATRRDASPGSMGYHACDRAECADALVCVDCMGVSRVSLTVEVPHCRWCGCTQVLREPRATAWVDLPHATALRAANVAHGDKQC